MPNFMTLSALSTEYVKTQVFATVAGVAYDPTNDTVQFAFMANNQSPGTTDWKSGSWEKNTTVSPAQYFARCLVGPNGGVLTLSAGSTYSVWMKITDNPEVPVRYVGDVVVV